MRCLLDTNVVSELVAKQPDPRVVRWIDSLDDDAVYLSVVTVGELARGIAKLPPSKRRDSLREWLHRDLLVRFEGRVLPLDIGAMLTWGDLTGRLLQKGRPLPAIDSLVAALALHHGCRLATRNVDDYSGVGLTLIDPWV